MNSNNYVEQMNQMIRKNCLKYKGLNISAEEFVPSQNHSNVIIRNNIIQNNKIQNNKQQSPTPKKQSESSDNQNIFNYRLYDNIVITSEFDYFVEPSKKYPDVQDVLFNRLENNFVKYNTWLFE